MDYKLEAVILPVSDVDKAKAFYSEQVGFAVDVDHSAGDQFRVVQLTPPGSACSIMVGIGLSDAAPGSVRGLHLVVTDIEAARAELVGRGVGVSDIRHMTPQGWQPGPDPQRADYGSFGDFADPDGNTLGASGEGLVVTATTGVLLDPRAFEALAGRHRRELHVHCYRMLASFDEAEDAVQETLLRAWRHREQFAGDTLVRAWLYRIATNVCLDLLRARSRRVGPLRSFAEVGWLQPYPDRLLDEIPSTDESPDAVAVARETIELAFLVALQVLPPRQRAALILRDVLGMAATETAALLETSVAAANSAVQRARARMQEHLPSHRLDWSAVPPGADERALLERFIDAHERCDAAAALAAASEDIRVTMPPNPMCVDGLAALTSLLDRAFGPDRDGDWRLVATTANRMPAAASYLRRPGDSEFRAFKLDVLRIEDGVIAEITTFGYALFPEFGLPATL